MNTKELLKKYWFIGVVGIALLAFIAMYSVDTYKNRDITVSNKTVDGKYLAYTIDDQPVFADDLYQDLYSYQNAGPSQAMVAYEREVYNAAYETTEEMKNTAAISASNVLNSYSREYLDNYLKSVGYVNGFDDLTDFYIDSLKQEQLIKDFVTANADVYLTPELGTNGRVIYHILVSCNTQEILDDEGNLIGYEALPNEEQSAKLTMIQELLQDEDNSFEYTAYQYSEDTGSKSYGGYIGLVNEENSDQFDPMFAEAALALAEGEVSEPIVSQYGYHIIKNAASSTDKILDDYYFLSDLQSSNRTLSLRATLAKGEELGFEIVSEELKNYYKSLLESEDE